jgi:hypothetical protein
VLSGYQIRPDIELPITGQMGNSITGNVRIPDFDLSQICSCRSNKWVQGPDMNEPRKRHSSLVHRDKLYVLGGTDVDGNSMEVLDLKRNFPTRVPKLGKHLYLDRANKGLANAI